MLNEKLIKELENLIEQIKFEIDTKHIISDTFRLKQFKFLIQTVKSFPTEIQNGNELSNIKGIGKGSIDRVNEILESGRLKEITIDVVDKKYLAQIEELEKIYGVGRKTAFDFIKNKNIKSVKELKKAVSNGIIKIPYHIELGLKYYGIYQETIPRKEINRINKYLQSIVKTIDINLELTICGSYRRERAFSNDIDILLVHTQIKKKTDIATNKNYLIEFVKSLHEKKFLLDDIDKQFTVKYMGFGSLNVKKYPIRRIDIIYMPYNSLGSSLLHFTGSGEFNKKIREIAINQGYSLSQYGLMNKETGKIIKCNTEEDIFKKLGLDFIPPNKRD